MFRNKVIELAKSRTKERILAPVIKAIMKRNDISFIPPKGEKLDIL